MTGEAAIEHYRAAAERVAREYRTRYGVNILARVTGTDDVVEVEFTTPGGIRVCPGCILPIQGQPNDAKMHHDVGPVASGVVMFHLCNDCEPRFGEALREALRA